MKNTSIFKLLTLMLAVLIVAAAIGCGKGGEQESTPTPVPTATASPTATTPAGESGTLSDIEGEVQVLKSGTSAWTAAANGMKIWTGDGLKTGSDGYALVTFFDGSVMEVNADTEISVDELSQAAGGATTVRIQQTIGNTLNRVQNLVDSSSTYEVTTPAGSAVVRGTIYSVEVEDDGKLTTCIKTKDERDTTEHFVEFSNGGGTVNVIENFFSCCGEGETPQTPAYSDPTNDPSTFESGGGGSSCITCVDCGDCPQGMWCNNGCCQPTPQPSQTSQPPCGETNGYCEYGLVCCEAEGSYTCQQFCDPDPDPEPPDPCPSSEYEEGGCCEYGDNCGYCSCDGV